VQEEFPVAITNGSARDARRNPAQFLITGPMSLSRVGVKRERRQEAR